MPDLAISKSHAGSFLQGQVGAAYTLAATNAGGSPTSGAVTINDTLPAGLMPTAVAGAGWACNLAGQAVSCTRTDPLAPGASYGPVTLTVDVAPDAPPSLTNTATISGGGDVNTANDTASDITTIGPGPDLIVAKSHAGNFIQGQTGAQFTVAVTNGGTSSTSGAVTLVDNVPAGLTLTAATGTGWNCGVAGATASCTRSDPLAPGASYAPVMISVDVAPNAPLSVTNTASLSGGGDVNTANNTATDVTTITPGPDLIIVKRHQLDFTQGQTIFAQFSMSVINVGGSPTSGPVTVTDMVPPGLVATRADGFEWECTISPAPTCTRSDPAPPGFIYSPVVLFVNVAPNAPPSVTNRAAVSGGGDVNPTNNTASDVTTIIPGPDLTISKSRAGSFFQGQVGATYTVAATNVGGTPTSGAVLVVDQRPDRTDPTAASGTGWNCAIAGPMVDRRVGCSRSDALAAGASYPPSRSP